MYIERYRKKNKKNQDRLPWSEYVGSSVALGSLFYFGVGAWSIALLATGHHVPFMPFWHWWIPPVVRALSWLY